MNNLSSLKTIFKTLIGIGVATSCIALPVRANESSLENVREELFLSQNFSDRDRGATDNFKNTVGIVGLAVGTSVIGWHLTRAYKPSTVNSLPIRNNNSTFLLDRISPKLRRELLRLVHNRQTASRLLSGTLNSHPSRSPNWAAEKVIYDLKRGR